MTELTIAKGKYEARVLKLDNEYKEKSKEESAKYKASCDELSTQYREDLKGVENSNGEAVSCVALEYELYKTVSEKLMVLYLKFQGRNGDLDTEFGARREALSKYYQREKDEIKGRSAKRTNEKADLEAFANSEVRMVTLQGSVTNTDLYNKYREDTLPHVIAYNDKCTAIEQKYKDGRKTLKKERQTALDALEVVHRNRMGPHRDAYLKALQPEGDGNE